MGHNKVIQAGKPLRPQRSMRGPSGLAWAGLALVSGVGLIVAVVVNLQHVVQQSEEQALWVAQRTEALGAKELQRALLSPELLEQVPEAQRFDWQRGRIVVPETVGWLVPESQAEGEGLDPLARDLVKRAYSAEGAAAWSLWQRALQDPGVDKGARDNLRLQAAWFAHREGDGEACDALLAKVSDGAHPEVRASKLLLLALRTNELPPDAMEVFGHLEPERARALAARLQDRAIPVEECVAWSEQQALRRARLRQLLPLDERQANAATPTWSVLSQDLLAIVFPEQQQGVWLDQAALQTWAQEFAGVPLELVGAEQTNPGAQRTPAPVIPGFVGARLPLQAQTSKTSGPVIMAVLVIALAGLCGGGAWLALRAARREAQAARLKGEFLTTVTHELKTPLAGIRLVSELLADDHVQDPDKRRRYLQALSAESTRLSMLIENVLDLRRMERGERVHDARVENLGALVRDTGELFAPLLERSGNQVHYQGLELGLEVLVDRDDLRQAFLNLLDNARKYGGQGDIHVQLIRRGERAVLRLIDGGEGVDPAERESIFERFARGQKHQHGGIPGVGIGLNLARAILRRQGGDLLACDPPAGQTGACFELSLPLHRT